MRQQSNNTHARAQTNTEAQTQYACKLSNQHTKHITLTDETTRKQIHEKKIANKPQHRHTYTHGLTLGTRPAACTGRVHHPLQIGRLLQQHLRGGRLLPSTCCELGSQDHPDSCEYLVRDIHAWERGVKYAVHIFRHIIFFRQPENQVNRINPGQGSPHPSYETSGHNLKQNRLMETSQTSPRAP